MQQFLSELPALIVTVAVLTMATIFLLYGHVAVGDDIAIVSPVIIFWFYKGAFTWQPLQGGVQGSANQQPQEKQP